MADRRMIASDIFEDEFIGQLSSCEFKIWIGLITTVADDQGRMIDNLAMLRSKLFVYENIELSEIETALKKFSHSGRITRYKVGSKAMIQLVNWWKHQSPSWAMPSKYPAPDGWTDKERYNAKGGEGVKENNWKHAGGYFVEEVKETQKDEGEEVPPEQPTDLPNGEGSHLGSQDGKGLGSELGKDIVLGLVIESALELKSALNPEITPELTNPPTLPAMPPEKANGGGKSAEGGVVEPEEEMQILFETILGIPANHGDIPEIKKCVELGITEEDIRAALKWRSDNNMRPVKTISALVPGCITNQGIARQKAGGSRTVPERKTDYMNSEYAGAYANVSNPEPVPKKSPEQINMETVWKLWLMDVSSHVKNQIGGVYPLEYTPELLILSVPSESVREFVDGNLRSSLERQFMSGISYEVQEREMMQ